MQDKVSALSIKEFVYEIIGIPGSDKRNKNFPFKNRRLKHRIPVRISCSMVFVVYLMTVLVTLVYSVERLHGYEYNNVIYKVGQK